MLLDVTPSSLGDGCQCFEGIWDFYRLFLCSEDGEHGFLRNMGDRLQQEILILIITAVNTSVVRWC
jgi:hypothetical protein